MAHDPDVNFVILGQTMQRQEQRLAHVTLSARGIVETWQPVMEALFGWTAAEAIGQPLALLVIPPALRDAHRHGLSLWESNAVAVVACKRLRTDGLHKDGHLVPVYIDVQIIRDDHGVSFLGWVTPVEKLSL